MLSHRWPDFHRHQAMNIHHANSSVETACLKVRLVVSDLNFSGWLNLSSLALKLQKGVSTSIVTYGLARGKKRKWVLEMDGLKNTQDISGTLTKHMVLNEIFLKNAKKLTFLAVSRIMWHGCDKFRRMGHILACSWKPFSCMPTVFLLLLTHSKNVWILLLEHHASAT